MDPTNTPTGNHAFRTLVFTAVVLVILSSCNVIIATVPDSWIEESGLGEYEMRPTFSWNVKGMDVAQGFRVAIDSDAAEGDWIELSQDIRHFRPDEFLQSGNYTFRLESKSVTGLWSRTATAQTTIFATEPFIPDDTHFSKPPDYDPFLGDPYQWNLEQIHMPELWGLIRSLAPARSEVVVAVVDTGYTEHPEILDAMDASAGYDFIVGDYYAQDGDDVDADATDEGDDIPGGVDINNSWHGTGVASVITAKTNNGEGIAGIDVPDSVGTTYLTHVPVRALGVGGGSTEDISNAIAYAAGLPSANLTLLGVPPIAAPAKIINLSLGLTGSYDAYMDPVLQAAAESGVILVAAAGNEGESITTIETTYPANSPYVISVGAGTYHGEIADYSNPGSYTSVAPTLDIVAPGGGPPYYFDWTEGGYYSWYEYIVTASPLSYSDQPIPTEDYTYVGTAGTSVAAPHVAGVLALFASIDDSIDLDMARAILRRSARDVGSTGWDSSSGYGFFDAWDAYGEFLLALSEQATPSSTARQAIRTSYRMDRPDTDPGGPVDPMSLIVRFSSATNARIVEATGISKVESFRPALSGEDRLVVLDGTEELSEARNRLLSREDVSEVFFSYRYRPL